MGLPMNVSNFDLMFVRAEIERIYGGLNTFASQSS